MPNTVFIVIFIFLLGLANASPEILDGVWEDFSNNFATDIAPLITLFGEQVTKQFLSESTGLLDNIIFGMAPLGIITAAVSAIRIYGWPGLKAFIGRAQEPHGVAEAELCSSTSHDVCELWTEGGFCRVFGRPKILEFFHRKGKDDWYPKFSRFTTEKEVEEPGACNLYQPVCFLDGNECCQKQRSRKGRNGEQFELSPRCDEKDCTWTEDSAKDSSDDVRPSSTEETRGNGMCFAPYPNLSLNIGILTTPRWVSISIAIFGSLIQLSFFAFAAIITFSRPGLYKDGKAPETWAFVLTMLGTSLVVFGMILCAFLIERKSRERQFSESQQVNADNIRAETTMYWLQPGNQRIGDQKFNAFSHSSMKRTYITSWKKDRGESHLPPSYTNGVLILALGSSATGFILQFTGLRGLHGSVALYQIAATLLMSMVRASLRLRRLGPEENEMRMLGTKIEGHELDWQALKIFQDHHMPEQGLGTRLGISLPEGGNVSDLLWHLCDERTQLLPLGPRTDRINGVQVIVSDGFHENAGVTGFRNSITAAPEKSDSDSWLATLECANEAVEVASYYENLHPVAIVALLRSRLAYLTGDGIVSVQPKWDGAARTIAQELQIAIQGVANYILSGDMTLKEHWHDISALTWHTTGLMTYKRLDEGASMDMISMPSCISFPMFRYEQEWKISKHKLEAVISLWALSLNDADLFEDLSEKVVCTREKSLYSTLRLWLPTGNLKCRRDDGSQTWSEAWLFQERRLLLMKLAEASQHSSPRWLITMRAKSSRIRLIAQLIFTIFVSRLADIIHADDMRHQDLLAEYDHPIADSQARGSVERFQGFSNAHVKAIARLFVQSGLGTEEEALMCVIPVFVEAKILPQQEIVMDKFVQRARKLRREGQFHKAEVLLKIMLDSGESATRKRPIREIGELYRKAYWERDFRLWALNGLCQMSRVGGFTDCGSHPVVTMSGLAIPTLKGWPKIRDLSRDEGIIFSRYSGLAKRLHDSSTPAASPIDQRSSDLRSYEGLVAQFLDSGSDASKLQEVAFQLMCIDPTQLGSLLKDKHKEVFELCVKHSFSELIDDLLGIHVDKVDLLARGWALHAAMEPCVDVRVMETIVELAKIDPNFPSGNEGGQTVLSLAIQKRRGDIVHLLLSLEAPVNARTISRAIRDCILDENGATPEMFPREFMALLLDKFPDVDVASKESKIVETACCVGNHVALKVLLKRRKIDLSNRMLLNKAAKQGHTETLQILLDAGLVSEIDTVEDDSDEGAEVERVFMKKSSTPPREIDEVVSQTYSTSGAALHNAIQSNQIETVKVLLDRQANVNTRIEGDLSYPLIMACFLGCDEIVHTLLASKQVVDVNAVGPIGSALAVACARNDTNVAKALIEKGALTNEQRGRLQSPLVVACLQGNDAIVEELLKRDAKNLDIIGIGGLTALCAAVKSQNVKIVKMLMKRGANANLAGARGDTPLQLAASAEEKNDNIVYALRNANANPSEPGNDRGVVKVPEQAAGKFDRSDVVRSGQVTPKVNKGEKRKSVSSGAVFPSLTLRRSDRTPRNDSTSPSAV